MSKRKKTRKEKIIADYRHQVYILKNEDISSHEVNQMPLAVTISKDSYFNAHILRDVLKTGILTLVIIALQIILFFLLKNHIITLPIVKY